MEIRRQDYCVYKCMLKVIRNILLVLLFLNCLSYAGDVVLLDISDEPLVAKSQLELACKFWGLKMEYLTLKDKKMNSCFSNIPSWNSIRAIVITERTINNLYLKDILSVFQEKGVESVPLLIIGITSQTNPGLLINWSDGAVVGCSRIKVVPFNGFYRISDMKNIARELLMQRIPFSAESVNYLILDKNRQVQTVVHYSNSDKKSGFPIFVICTTGGQEVFFLTSIHSHIKEGTRYDFVDIIPFLMFLRYSCGKSCWHGIRDYANFTIDDPWLIEPYGQLNYKGLYEEMQNAHFHTTIAFIPWNYDRSKPDVVSLFRNYPERLSICIHGNNHDHYEFYKYDTGPGDPWPAKPLNTQEADIKQALARMEKFRSMTGISCDKVMVFPHSIAPAKTLGLLKKYNFLATVNAENVPLGSDEQKDSSFLLRPVTLNFENFPSLKRYSPNRTQAEIAIDLFLDNPIIFYAHHDFFQNGIDAFDKTANMVNKIQPDIVWQSLGYISQHLYLEKLRDDGNYDVKTFSSNFILENINHNDLVYFVRKEEDFSIPIKQVTVDGQIHYYKKSGNNLILEVFVPAGESRNVVIEYENSLDISSIDVSKNDPRINRLRKLSDFRDMTLSKNVFGRVFTRVYYDTGLYKFGLIRLAIILLVLFVLVIIISFVIWRIIRSRKTEIKI